MDGIVLCCPLHALVCMLRCVAFKPVSFLLAAPPRFQVTALRPCLSLQAIVMPEHILNHIRVRVRIFGVMFR